MCWNSRRRRVVSMQTWLWSSAWLQWCRSSMHPVGCKPSTGSKMIVSKQFSTCCLELLKLLCLCFSFAGLALLIFLERCRASFLFSFQDFPTQHQFQLLQNKLMFLFIRPRETSFVITWILTSGIKAHLALSSSKVQGGCWQRHQGHHHALQSFAGALLSPRSRRCCIWSSWSRCFKMLAVDCAPRPVRGPGWALPSSSRFAISHAFSPMCGLKQSCSPHGTVRRMRPCTKLSSNGLSICFSSIFMWTFER